MQLGYENGARTSASLSACHRVVIHVVRYFLHQRQTYANNLHLAMPEPVESSNGEVKHGNIAPPKTLPILELPMLGLNGRLLDLDNFCLDKVELRTGRIVDVRPLLPSFSIR
jgi:hypothetical protein